MSGGHFDYNQYRFQQTADDIGFLIEQNEEEDEYGNSSSYSAKTLEHFREAQDLLNQAARMVKMIDYLASGDTGEDAFEEAWKALDSQTRNPSIDF